MAPYIKDMEEGIADPFPAYPPSQLTSVRAHLFGIPVCTEDQLTQSASCSGLLDFHWETAIAGLAGLQSVGHSNKLVSYIYPTSSSPLQSLTDPQNQKLLKSIVVTICAFLYPEMVNCDLFMDPVNIFEPRTMFPPRCEQVLTITCSIF